MAGWTVKATVTDPQGNSYPDGMTFTSAGEMAHQIARWIEWSTVNANDELEIHITPNHS